MGAAQRQIRCSMRRAQGSQAGSVERRRSVLRDAEAKLTGLKKCLSGPSGVPERWASATLPVLPSSLNFPGPPLLNFSTPPAVGWQDAWQWVEVGARRLIDGTALDS